MLSLVGLFWELDHESARISRKSLVRVVSCNFVVTFFSSLRLGLLGEVRLVFRNKLQPFEFHGFFVPVRYPAIADRDAD